VHVICPASGYPLDTITWAREGGDLSASGRVAVFPNGSMVVHSVTAGDGGHYTCTATNRRGLSSSRTALVKVIGMSVMSPPHPMLSAPHPSQRPLAWRRPARPDSPCARPSASPSSAPSPPATNPS